MKTYNATLHLAYRRVHDLKLKLHKCGCGTLTPRKERRCGKCLGMLSRAERRGA